MAAQAPLAVRRLLLDEKHKAEVRAIREEAADRIRPRNPFSLPVDAKIDEKAEGVDLWQRMVLTNFAANPENAANWLKSQGYEVYLYEPGEGGTEPASGPVALKWRIAVRKPGEPTFKVVDPAGLDASDITDLFADLLFGAAAGAATALGTSLAGPPGGAVFGAAAANMGEQARQGLGNVVSKAFGTAPINPTPDQDAIAGATLGGMAGGPLSEVQGFLGRKTSQAAGVTALGVKRIVGGVLSGLTKVTPEQLQTAVANRAIILRPLIGEDATRMAAALAQRVMQFLTGLDETRTAEYQQAQQILASKGTGQVRLKPILENIRNEVLSPFKEVSTTPTYAGVPTGPTSTVKVARTPGKFGLASDTNDRVRAMLVDEAGKLAKNAGADSVEDAIRRDLPMPVDQAESLKRLYAENANYAAKALQPDAAVEKAHGFLADELREGVRTTIDPAAIGDPSLSHFGATAAEQYEGAMKQAGVKLGLAKDLQNALVSKGAEEVPAAPGPHIDEPAEVVQATNRPEQFFRTYLNKGARSGQHGLIEKFSELWRPELSAPGVGLEDLPNQAKIASTYSAYGAESGDAFGGNKGVNFTIGGLSFGGRPLGLALGASIGGGLGGIFGLASGDYVTAAKDAALGATIGGGLGFYFGSPRGSINAMAAVNKGLDEFVTPMVSAAPEAAATAPARFGTAAAAPGVARDVNSDLERDQARTRAIVNSDTEAMDALSKIAGEVRAMAAANPNLSQEQIIDEFRRRKDEWLAKRGLVMATPGAAAAPPSTPPAP